MARSDLELPADLVTEILLKLPVKSMIRFRCVAKTWYHLLKSPTFVSQHLSKKNRSNSHIVVHYRRDKFNKKIGMLSFTEDQALVSYQDLHQRLPSHLADKKFFSLAVGDGLVCLYDFIDSGLTLWNPATKESRILPDCKHYIPPRMDDYVYPLLGCGIDPLSNDYKVLNLRKYSPREFKKRYAIYRMSSDSWRVLKEEDAEIVEKLASVDPNKGNSCVNGVCYWQVINLSPWPWDHCEFLVFHLSTEVFRLLRSPSGTCGELIPLHDGRIAFWDPSNVNPRTDPCGIWVLNDKENWTKLLNIDLLPEVLTIYCFWTHGKVFVDGKDGELSLYDLETRGESGFEANCTWVYKYEESLLAVCRE